MKIILCFVALLTLMTCVNHKQSIQRELREDTLITEFFNDREIIELGKIILFFETQVLEVNKFTIQKSYEKFLKEDSIRFIDDHQLHIIALRKQKKLFSKLNSDFLNSFFDKGYLNLSDLNTNKFYKIQYHHLKVYDSVGLSKYAKFIEKYSDSNHYIKGYLENAKKSNEFFAPTDQGRFIENYRNFDFNDIKNRLIYSMNHLLISERNKR